MESNEYYLKRLYPLQDRILTILGNLNSPFYLTGGTALSRFYLQHRYSDDLDLFTNADPNFKTRTEEVLSALTKANLRFSVGVSGSDFIRVFVVVGDIDLKLEFINDVPFYYLNTIRFGSFNLDNWQNILTNKISALSRNEAKDFADILFLCSKYKFNWTEIFDATKEKDAWVNEIIIAEMIEKYDPEKLKGIKWIIPMPAVIQMKDSFRQIAKDILLGGHNTLKGL